MWKNSLPDPERFSLILVLPGQKVPDLSRYGSQLVTGRVLTIVVIFVVAEEWNIMTTRLSLAGWRERT
jgi:hypothetical protein